MIYQHYCGQIIYVGKAFIDVESEPNKVTMNRFFMLKKASEELSTVNLVKIEISHCSKCKNPLFQNDVDTSLLKLVSDLK